MSAIDKLLGKLAKYPAAKVTRKDRSITIEPQDDVGFRVELVAEQGHCTVFFDGWHEEFESEEEALDCVGFGLSPACRLAVTYRGPFPYKWSPQHRVDGEWRTESVTGLFLVPFWWRRRVVYKQNHLVDPPVAASGR